MFGRIASASRAFLRSFATYGGNRWRVDDDDTDWAYCETGSGVEITRRKAYGCSYWYRAINVISATVAKTPLDVIDVTDGQRKPDLKHPAYRLLGGLNKPNDETLRFHFFQTLTAHAVGHGGGYAYIYRDTYGRPTEIYQLRPDRTWPVRENGKLMYVTSIGGDFGDSGAQQKKLLAENVMHIHGLGWDGLTAYSLLDLAAEALGSAIAKEQFGAKFFKNSATPSVAIKVAKKMSDTAMKHLKDSWSSLRTGLENAHKPVLLEDGMELMPFSVNAADSQLITAMERDPILISNFTGVPPYKLGVKGYNSYNSLEIMSQEFLDDTIDPWFVPWEEEIEAKLFTAAEQKSESRRARFRRKELIRVDAMKRASIHRTELGGHPYRAVNEVRQDEGDNPLPGFDFIPTPLNMSGGKPAAGDLPAPDPNADPASDKNDPNYDPSIDPNAEQTADAVRQLWLQACERMAKRLHTAAEKRLKQGELDETTFSQEHTSVLRSVFSPLAALTPGDLSADRISAEMCRSVVASARAQSLADWLDTTPARMLKQILQEKPKS